MDVRGRMSAAVFEALRHLGKGRVGELEVRHLSAILSAKDILLTQAAGRVWHFAKELMNLERCG